MRHYEPNPTDDATGRDRRRSHQGGGGDHNDAQHASIHPECGSLLVAQCHNVDAPAQQSKRYQSDLTAAEVIKVAAAITMTRSMRVFTPSAVASSSPNVITSMRQRSRARGTNPI